jgi:hypothetical protein
MIEWEGMDWTNVAQDRDNWQAVVNTALKFMPHKMWKFLDQLRNY